MKAFVQVDFPVRERDSGVRPCKRASLLVWLFSVSLFILNQFLEDVTKAVMMTAIALVRRLRMLAASC